MDAPSDYEKCVVILDGSLPRGLLANAAAILGVTLGRRLPETVGPDVVDRSGRVHPGIVRFPVPVLQGTPESLRQLRAALEQPDFRDLTAADFSELAQECRTYDEFPEKMGRTPESALRYLGVAVCGPKKKGVLESMKKLEKLFLASKTRWILMRRVLRHVGAKRKRGTRFHFK